MKRAQNKLIPNLIFIQIAFILSTKLVLGQTDTADVIEIKFFGSGNIQKSLDEGEKIPAATGLGVSYIQKYGQDNHLWDTFNKIQLDVSINVASTVDTLTAAIDSSIVSNTSDFGSSILTPLNSGQAVSVILRMDLDNSIGNILDGIKFKYIGSNRNWSITNDTISFIGKATNNSIRFGILHEFIPKQYQNNYSINFGLYFAYNSLKGDIGLDRNSEYRKAILGTSHKDFTGGCAELEIRLKNIRAEFSYSIFPSKDEVPGLTGGRLITTISFVGGFGLETR